MAANNAWSQSRSQTNANASVSANNNNNNRSNSPAPSNPVSNAPSVANTNAPSASIRSNNNRTASQTSVIMQTGTALAGHPKHNNSVENGTTTSTLYVDFEAVGENGAAMTHPQLISNLSRVGLGQPVTFMVRPTSDPTSALMEWAGILAFPFYDLNTGEMRGAYINFDSRTSKNIVEFCTVHNIPIRPVAPWIQLPVPVPGVDYNSIKAFHIIDAGFQGVRSSERQQFAKSILVPYLFGDVNIFDFQALGNLPPRNIGQQQQIQQQNITNNNNTSSAAAASSGNNNISNNNNNNNNAPAIIMPNALPRAVQDPTYVRYSQNQMLTARQAQPDDASFFNYQQPGNNNLQQDDGLNDDEPQQMFKPYDVFTWHLWDSQQFGHLDIFTVFEQLNASLTKAEEINKFRSIYISLQQKFGRGRGRGQGARGGRGNPYFSFAEADEMASKTVEQNTLSETHEFSMVDTYITFLVNNNYQFEPTFAAHAAKGLMYLRAKIEGVSRREVDDATSKILPADDIGGRVVKNIAQAKELEAARKLVRQQQYNKKYRRNYNNNNFGGYNNNNNYGGYNNNYNNYNGGYNNNNNNGYYPPALNNRGGAQASSGTPHQH